MALKSTNIVFVHGLFGWAPPDEMPVPYWGEAKEQFEPQFKTHEAKCGPMSSFHDRACEVFAQIRGGPVEYDSKKPETKKHSEDNGHGPNLGQSFPGVVPGWSADNPVILIGHSAGAHTCLLLQQMLADDFWNVGSNADWVEVVVSVAGVLNGSTLTYMFCNKKTGKLTALPSVLFNGALALLKAAAKVKGAISSENHALIEPWLGHWPGGLDSSAFVAGEDNLGFDLSLRGCQKANRAVRTHPGTYYFSLVTSGLKFKLFGFFPLGLVGWGDMFQPLQISASFQAEKIDFDPAQPPCDGWGAGDLTIDKWRENDGAVSSISQRFPFTGHSVPTNAQGVFSGTPKRGQWRWDYLDDLFPGLTFDHLDPVFGPFVKSRPFGWGEPRRKAQPEMYRKLKALFEALT